MAGFGDDPVFRAYRDAPQEFKNGMMERVRAYAKYLVQYVKREKLSGQVLGQRTKVLHKTFGANVYNDGPSIQFMETVYGRAWEYGFTRERYFVKPVNAKALAWRGPGGKMIFSRGHWIPDGTFAPRPHIAPAILETRKVFETRIWRPFVKFMTGSL